MTESTTLESSSAVARMAGRAHQAVDETAGKAVPALEHASAAAHRTIDKVADTALAASDRAAESGRKLGVRAGAVADSCGNFVRAKPFTSMAGALALGYVAGRLLR